MTKNNWTNLYLTDDYYIVKNIRFTKDGKPYELKELVVSWEELSSSTNFASDFANKHQALGAYYWSQLFMDADVEFDMERISDKELKSHIQEVNDLIEHLQPCSATFDNEKLSAYVTEDVVEYNYSPTWFTIVPADYELACTYLNEDEASLLREQAAFQTLLNTMPVEIVGSVVIDTRQRVAKHPRNYAEYKRCIVNNSLTLPILGELSLSQFKMYNEVAITDERLN